MTYHTGALSEDARIASLMGCTRGTVTRWRLGTTKPMEATKRLAKAIMDEVPEYLK